MEAEARAQFWATADQRAENGHRLVVRNGYHQPGEVLTSAGAVDVTAPRVNDKRTDPIWVFPPLAGTSWPCRIEDAPLDALMRQQKETCSPERSAVRNIESAMDDDPDPRLQLLETLRQRSEANAAELDAFDAGCLRVTRQCVNLWYQLWRDTPVAIDSTLEVKFRICFPLAAHALNHVDAALGLHRERPWVAASSARVAFEHALAAQWVFLTVDGERELVNWMKRQQYVRAKEIAEALRQLASDPGASEPLLDESQRRTLVGDPPDSSGWSVANACSRFSDTKLFYDIYRDLSQAEHPSPGLIATHLAVASTGVQGNISAAGVLHPSGEVPRALALSALWSLYVLEQLREGQPHAATVAHIGHEASLPTDLRASDQHPERQPEGLRQRDE